MVTKKPVPEQTSDASASPGGGEASSASGGTLGSTRPAAPEAPPGPRGAGGLPVGPADAARWARYATGLAAAKGLPDLFSLVKRGVREFSKRERTGLMLGLANLGGGTHGLIGGFYQVAGNVIVMNSLPLARLRQTKPTLEHPFALHILLHEYIHALGVLDEEETRRQTLATSLALFGPHHAVTMFAVSWREHFPNLVYPVVGYAPPGGFQMEIVRGFDPDASPYIA